MSSNVCSRLDFGKIFRRLIIVHKNVKKNGYRQFDLSGTFLSLIRMCLFYKWMGLLPVGSMQIAVYCIPFYAGIFKQHYLK